MTASQLTVPPATCTVLLLAESEGERKCWLQVLGELQQLLRDTRPRPRPVYTLKEAYDNGLPLLPHTLCAAIIGEPRAEGAARGRLGGGARSLGPLSLPNPCSPELWTLARVSSSALPWAWLCEGPGLGGESLASATPFLCTSLSAFSQRMSSK